MTPRGISAGAPRAQPWQPARRCCRLGRMPPDGHPVDAAADRGSATVLGLAVIGVVTLVMVAALTIASVAVTAHQARTAADLSAIAAAQVLLGGGADTAACERAGRVAGDNDAALTRCTVARQATGAAAGPRVAVTVSRDTMLTWWPVVQAHADAGLVPAPP